MRTAFLESILLVALLTSCSNDALEGTWKCVSAVVDGKPLSDKTVGQLRLTLSRDRYKTEKGSEVLFDSTYTIDPSKNPRQIDMVGTEGDLAGKKAQGIYELRGDNLILCYTLPGKERPKAFESKPGSGASLIVWKRATQSAALGFWFKSELPLQWDVIVLGLAVFLAAQLCFRIWRRNRYRRAEALWTGRGIDVAPIAGRVQRARGDFVSELHARPHETSQPAVTSARKVIAQFPYFRRRRLHTEAAEGTDSHFERTS